MNDKILFLHYLRGFASLLVMIGHLGFSFFINHETVSTIAKVPPYALETPFWVELYISFSKMTGFNLGSFGVGLFFLISGFVIIISIEKYGSINFLIGRVFRLYPSYILGLAVTVLFLFLSSLYFHTQFSITWGDYLKNISLFRDIFWVQMIDFIVWTLEIELKFYIIIALLYAIKNKITLTHIVWFPITLTIISYIGYINLKTLYLGDFFIYKIFYIISADSASFIFMFIGALFYFKYTNRIKLTYFILTLLFFIALFLINTNFTPGAYSSLSYLYALALFTVSYYFKESFGNHKLLNFFANISYPMYILHGINGYIIMRILLNYTNNYFFLLIPTISIVLAMSYAIHVYIEVPTHKLGRKFMFHSYGGG